MNKSTENTVSWPTPAEAKYFIKQNKESDLDRQIEYVEKTMAEGLTKPSPYFLFPERECIQLKILDQKLKYRGWKLKIPLFKYYEDYKIKIVPYKWN